MNVKFFVKPVNFHHQVSKLLIRERKNFLLNRQLRAILII